MKFVLVSAWKSSINAVIKSVGMLLCPLNSIEEIQPRMMCASFNGNLYTTIISSYNPTNASDERNLIPFNNMLSSLVQHIPKQLSRCCCRRGCSKKQRRK